MKEGKMEKTFTDLGVSPSIIKAIEKMEFFEPTEVQREAIPHVLQKKDLIVMSKTGSGKTGAFEKNRPFPDRKQPHGRHRP